MGGRGGSGGRGLSFGSLTTPIIGGDYKATPEMNELAMKIARDMQKDFPLLGDQFRIEFDKYMGNTAGNGFHDYIELNGAHFKKLLKSGNYDEFRGVIAHELTHTMQARLNTSLGLKGSAGEQNNEKIWNAAVNRFIKANPKHTLAEINKAVSNAYGGGGHSRYGGDATERMAVAVENVYNGNKTSLPGRVGKYVIDELKRRRKKVNAL